jgi:hypothetical protein
MATSERHGPPWSCSSTSTTRSGPPTHLRSTKPSKLCWRSPLTMSMRPGSLRGSETECCFAEVEGTPIQSFGHHHETRPRLLAIAGARVRGDEAGALGLTGIAAAPMLTGQVVVWTEPMAGRGRHHCVAAASLRHIRRACENEGQGTSPLRLHCERRGFGGLKASHAWQLSRSILFHTDFCRRCCALGVVVPRPSTGVKGAARPYQALTGPPLTPPPGRSGKQVGKRR